jgi:hypothetical protein
MLGRLGEVIHRGCRVTVVILAMGAVFGCEPKPPPKITQLETISVRGTCKEDHANKAGQYSGFLYLYRVNAIGKIRVMGFLNNKILLPADFLTSPGKYQPPDSIDLDDVSPDLATSHWTVHGISELTFGERTEPGYDSTCELDVMQRHAKPPKAD